MQLATEALRQGSGLRARVPGGIRHAALSGGRGRERTQKRRILAPLARHPTKFEQRVWLLQVTDSVDEAHDKSMAPCFRTSKNRSESNVSSGIIAKVLKGRQKGAGTNM